MDDNILKMRTEEIDCNAQQSFFSTLIKALILDLTNRVRLRDINIPHIIYNTGDDTMWLLQKDYNYSKEPFEVTNEQYIYDKTPRCVLTPHGIDILSDQLSNPHCRGQFQIEIENQLYTIDAEFRRMPIKMSVDLQYLLDTFKDALDLMQQIVAKLMFMCTFKFVYLGQTMVASYTIPSNLEEEHMMDIDGTTQDSKDRKISISIEVETNMPVISSHTIVNADTVITQTVSRLSTTSGTDLGERNPYETSKYKGFGRKR